MVFYVTVFRSQKVYLTQYSCEASSNMDPIVNDDQQDENTLAYLFIPSQLYVFRAVFAHHQEHLTVFKASGIDHRYCCRLVSWMRWN